MPLDFNELRQLLLTLDQTDIAELTLKSDDFELTVRKAIAGKHQFLPTAESAIDSIAGGLQSKAANSSTMAVGGEAVASRLVEPIATSAQLPSVSPQEQKFVEIASPMVGTFYRAPAPGESAFVEIGDRVRVGQTVCIIEAMKLMNEIESEVSGQVIEVLVQNGEPIEFGQPLMRIYPD